MGRWAYAAVAASTPVEEGPEEWPPDWDWPPPDGGPLPPDFDPPSLDAVFSTPFPADDAVEVVVNPTLTWVFTLEIDGVATTPDSYEVLIDDVSVGSTSSASFSAGTLTAGAHTWRVVAKYGSRNWLGPEWSFQTVMLLSGRADAVVSAVGHLWDAAGFLSGEASAAVFVESAALAYYTPPGAPSDVVATWGGTWFSGYPRIYVNGTWNASSGATSIQVACANPPYESWETYTFAGDATSMGDGYAWVYNLAGYNAMLRVRGVKTVDGVTTYSAWAYSPELLRP